MVWLKAQTDFISPARIDIIIYFSPGLYFLSGIISFSKNIFDSSYPDIKTGRYQSYLIKNLFPRRLFLVCPVKLFL